MLQRYFGDTKWHICHSEAAGERKVMNAKEVQEAKDKEAKSWLDAGTFQLVPSTRAKGHDQVQYLWVIRWKPLSADELKVEQKKGSKKKAGPSTLRVLLGTNESIIKIEVSDELTVGELRARAMAAAAAADDGAGAWEEGCVLRRHDDGARGDLAGA